MFSSFNSQFWHNIYVVVPNVLALIYNVKCATCTSVTCYSLYNDAEYRSTMLVCTLFFHYIILRIYLSVPNSTPITTSTHIPVSASHHATVSHKSIYWLILKWPQLERNSLNTRFRPEYMISWYSRVFICIYLLPARTIYLQFTCCFKWSFIHVCDYSYIENTYLITAI